MVTEGEYAESVADEDVDEMVRINDNLIAAFEMDEGPAQEQVLDAVYQDAERLDSVFHMAAARSAALVSMFQRGEYREGLRMFVQAQHLIGNRGDELPDGVLEALKVIVLQPLDSMATNPSFSRATIEGFLDQLESEVQAGKAGRAEHALCRAYWHAHTGERDLFDPWFDRWLTGGSDWWASYKTNTIGMASEMLGGFDPAAALDYLERTTPTMQGKPERKVELLIDLAGWRALCGKPYEARDLLVQLFRDPDVPPIAELGDNVAAWALLRAADEIPLDSPVPDLPGARQIAEVAVERTQADEISYVHDTAALARFYHRRNAPAEVAKWRPLAEERARAYDARNGNNHHVIIQNTRWLNEI